MTVTEQVTYISQILGDTDNTKWQSSTHIVPALNSAQEEFVIKIVGLAQQNRKAFGVLSELQASSTQSINTTGYALSGLDSTYPYVRNGLIAAKGTIDSVTRWFQIIDVADLGLQRNSYMQGNDERPQIYEFGEKLYILVSTGSYPISTTFYYIRRPGELVASGATGTQVTTCELDVMFHRMIAEIGAANCWRMLGDESSIGKYDRIMKRIDERIMTIVASGKVEARVEGQEV